MENYLKWEQTLFKDRELFDFGHVPEQFFYRETQMKSIGYAIAPGIQGEQPQNIVCIGPPGTGKTTSFKKIIEQAEQISPSKLIFAYVNCRYTQTHYSVIGEVYKKMITIHTDPDTAEQEIGDLPAVVDDARSRYQGEGDFIVMGDLNADCNYFNENSQSPLRSGDYRWIIDNSLDTTTKSTNCAYDRIIITTPAKNDFTGDSGVFRFDTAYNLNYESTVAVSDHYPVYVNFWNNRDTD